MKARKLAVRRFKGAHYYLTTNSPPVSGNQVMASSDYLSAKQSGETHQPFEVKIRLPFYCAPRYKYIVQECETVQFLQEQSNFPVIINQDSLNSVALKISHTQSELSRLVLKFSALGPSGVRG